MEQTELYEKYHREDIVYYTMHLLGIYIAINKLPHQCLLIPRVEISGHIGKCGVFSWIPIMSHINMSYKEHCYHNII